MQSEAKEQEFILAEIDRFNREIELTRHNKALMKLLDSRGKQTKTLKAADVKKTARFRLNIFVRSARQDRRTHP